MARNMSFALTERQLLDGSKTVTRRVGWKTVCTDDVLVAVRKSMGLKKGEKVHVLGTIKVTWANDEPLSRIDQQEVVREGFPHMTPEEFISFFCQTHRGCTPDTVVRRIAFHFTPMREV